MSEENTDIRRISAEAFLKLDKKDVTLLDLREPDELIVDSIPGALNAPFSKFPAGLDSIPKEKPVYVYCGHGDFSEEVTEILEDRGYDAINVDGGYAAIRKARGREKGNAADSAAASASSDAVPRTDSTEKAQQVIEIDAKGLKCPGPIVKVGDTLRSYPEGTVFRVEATEDAFWSDIQVWCERTGNQLNSINRDGSVIRAEITRTQDAGKHQEKSVAVAETPHGKNFVVFDDDLDKVIAAFIMANGSAAMGRPVTMFFTFWGLNVLRKPEKVKVKKNFVEKMFGWMMPRGTKKLPLSHMNMGGMGPKMIRSIMKQHGISSVEELIQSALDHGVRIIVCQMSMDIMGIKKEELYDGLEYGGVSTFLGNAELSDMSLFI